MPRTYRDISKERARSNRRNMTSTEWLIWREYLRNHECKFRRQYVIEPYIADFYSAKLKLVIEIDGSQHFEEEAEKYDERRTKFFSEKGIGVIRFDNEFVARNLDGVIECIEKRIAEILGI